MSSKCLFFGCRADVVFPSEAQVAALHLQTHACDGEEARGIFSILSMSGAQ